MEGSPPDDWRDSIYYQIYHANEGIQRRLPHYGIRTARYKLAYWYREIEDWELYDLEEDPQEMRNVFRDPAYAERRRANCRTSCGGSALASASRRRWNRTSPRRRWPANGEKRSPPTADASWRNGERNAAPENGS